MSKKEVANTYADFSLDINDKYLDLALNHRKIFINDEITKEQIFDVVYCLHKIIAQDELASQKKPIYIYINSNGGYCSEGFILLDLIEQIKSKGYEINTVVTGVAYSFGFILALVGTHRYCYRHCDLMCHTVQLFAPPLPLPDFEKTVRRAQKMQGRIEEYVFNHTKITTEMWAEKIEQGEDWYIDANEALELGICDEVI